MLRKNGKYLVAVALLAVFAVAFGVLGTVAPPLAEESAPIQPQQESSPDSVGHFTNPPTYDSGWVNITTKAGQYVTLKHNLNTTNVVVDVTGKQSLDPMGGALAWGNTYGGGSSDRGYSVVQTSDGGYALAGDTYSFGAGEFDFWLVKTDSAGTKLWSQTYGGAGSEHAYSIVQTSDGGYALAGYSNSSGAGNYDMLLVKTDSAGNLQWSKTYGGTDVDYAYSLIQTSDGGYALVGFTRSLGAGYNDIWLVKTDASGSHQWNRTYGGAGSDYAYSIVQTTGDGGYALAGSTGSYGAGSYDFWLVKTGLNGMKIWDRTYGGLQADYAYSVVQTSDGGYALAGDTYSFLKKDDVWLVKTDAYGNHQWNKTYGKVNYDRSRSLVQTVDGGYALAGLTNSFGAGAWDFWLVKTDSIGTQLWNQTYGGAGVDIANSLVQTDDGGYAIVGYTNSFGAGNDDVWLIKLKPEMNLEHQRHLGGTSLIYGWSRTYGGSGFDAADSVIQTDDGGYAIAGTSTSYSAGDYDFLLVKTDVSGNVQWRRTYGGLGNEFAASLVQTLDGGYAIAGDVADDFLLVKIDAFGNEQWSTQYGGPNKETARSLVQTVDGGYAIAGSTDSYGAGGYDFWLVKTDSAGFMQWSTPYGGGENDEAHSLVQTSDGGYAIAGSTRSYGLDTPTNPNFWLVKIDASGGMQWSVPYGGTNVDWASSLVQTNDGGYALAGYTGTASVGGDFWLVKTDPAGTAQWNRRYGGTSTDDAYSLVQTLDGGYAIAGSTGSYGDGVEDFWLVKTDASGTTQWMRTYGGAYGDSAYSLVQTDDGGYSLAGDTRSYGSDTPTNPNFWLVKTDIESGLARTGLTTNSITLYRGLTDPYWNYVRIRIWTIKEPSWIYGDINMDGIVDAQDLYILSRNYGKTFSLLSLTGIIAIAGIRTVKKRKQNKQPSYIS